MLSWCQERKVHYISDEIYGGASAWGAGTGHSDGQTMAASSSAPVVARDVVGWEEGNPAWEHLHVVYALSKDFGLSGLRVGVLYTQSDALTPLQKLNDLCQTSSHTQAMMTEVLNDTEWLAMFEGTARSRLQQRHAWLASVLDEVGIEHMNSEAGMFTWMDLRPWLPHDVAEGECPERVLSKWLMHEVGVAMTPGLSMAMSEPGFYRMVYSAASDEDFAVAMARIEAHFGTV